MALVRGGNGRLSQEGKARERRFNSVACNGGEGLQEAAKAQDGPSLRGLLLSGLDLGTCGARTWVHGCSSSAGRILMVIFVEQDRCEPLAHFPFDVVGEHADEDMDPHSVRVSMVDGADLQVYGL